MQWTNGYAESVYSFANTINTHEGGMHEEGLKKALTNVLNRYARTKGLLKEKDDNLIGEDVREGLVCDHLRQAPRSAVRGPDEDEARQRVHALAGRDHRERAVRRVARGASHRGHAASCRRSQQAAKARLGRQAGARPHPPEVVPGRRQRCPASSPTASSTIPGSCELYIVEGDSAGGSAKGAQEPCDARPSCPSAARS